MGGGGASADGDVDGGGDVSEAGTGGEPSVAFPFPFPEGLVVRDSRWTWCRTSGERPTSHMKDVSAVKTNKMSRKRTKLGELLHDLVDELL